MKQNEEYALELSFSDDEIDAINAYIITEKLFEDICASARAHKDVPGKELAEDSLAAISCIGDKICHLIVTRAKELTTIAHPLVTHVNIDGVDMSSLYCFIYINGVVHRIEEGYITVGKSFDEDDSMPSCL